MKKPRAASSATLSKTIRAARALDACRLSAVRGGLGITVEAPPPAPQVMQIQHNERLLRL